MAHTMRPHGGHIADKLRGRGQSKSRPAFYFPRENPTANCLGELRQTSGGLEARPKPTTQGGQVADKDWRYGQTQQHKADQWRTRTGGAAKADTRLQCAPNKHTGKSGIEGNLPRHEWGEKMYVRVYMYMCQSVWAIGRLCELKWCRANRFAPG